MQSTLIAIANLFPPSQLLYVASRKVSCGGDRTSFSQRLLKQSSPQISVASRLLSSVPKSHPHTLKTSRAACVRGGAHWASAGPPLTFTPILSPYDWCL